jgi:acyl-CoA hydrolase
MPTDWRSASAPWRGRGSDPPEAARVPARIMADAPPEPRSPRQSEAVVSELMMPHQVNNVGHVFGGEILSMVDRAAAVSAMRHSGRPSVTVSIDQVEFKEPIFSGELVTCLAQVTYVGRTSMEVDVQVTAENLLTGVKRNTNSCYLTFVAIDEDHRPCPVPPLKPETPEEERRYREGERRREVRLQLSRELQKD